MANSLNFLNKPAPAKPASIGPQPKPGAAAPKSPFLDTSNPWAIPGRSTPAPTPAKPKTQTPQPQPAGPPARATPRATPQPARGDARATPQPQPARAAPRPTPQPQPARVNQAIAPARQAAQDAPLDPWLRGLGYAPDWQAQEAARQAPLSDPFLDSLQAARAAQRNSARGNVPSTGYNYTDAMPAASLRVNIPITGYNYTDAPPGMTAPAPQPARPFQPQPLSPSGSSYGYAGAPQPAPARVNIPATGYNYTDAPPGMTAPAPQPAPARVNIPATGYNYTDAPPGMTAPAPQPAPARVNIPATGYNYTDAPPGMTAPNPQARGPFYGYAPPGPLVLDRRARIQANLQPGQLMPYTYNARPLYTNLGVRALMSDEALAIEDVRRQRDAAGGIVALQTSGMFRPWSSYSPAEKYYLRYGVMPQGEQAPPDTSGIAAMEASRAQTQRLVGEYKDTYGRYPKWDSYAYRRPDQQPGAVLAGTATAPAAPAAPTPAAGAQAQVNNAALAQVNPAAVRNGAITNAVTENDVSVVARQILQRYRPELPADAMTFTDIIAILSEYAPPQDRAAMYNEDAAWLSGFLASE